jgi:hypothetical protein
MRRILLIILAVLTASLFSSLQVIAGEEKITLETFYPAPLGVYSEMETNILYFVPQGPRTCVKEGEVFYDLANHVLKICNGGLQPVTLSGGLKTKVVGCTAYSASNSPLLYGWGCSVSCPTGTKIIGGGYDFGQIFSPHHSDYSKPIANQEGWTCFEAAILGNMDAGWFKAGDGCSDHTASGAPYSCAGHVACQAVCTTTE